MRIQIYVNNFFQLSNTSDNLQYNIWLLFSSEFFLE